MQANKNKKAALRGFWTSLVALLVHTTAAADTWPIKDFEVVVSDQYSVLDLDITKGNVAADQSALTPELKRQVEDYLAQVAQKLEGWGFPPPVLEPAVERADGRRAYRVYAIPRGDEEGAYQNSDMLGRSIMSLNLTALSGRGGQALNRAGRELLGHELFHAVQYATPFFRSYDQDTQRIGSWITEGQALAIGHDLADEISGTLKSTIPTAIEARWGLRSYSAILPVPKGEGSAPQIGYRTASFWRYLGELDQLRKTHFSALENSGQMTDPNPRPGPRPGPVDYRYLSHLLNGTAAASTSRAEVTWLDLGLKAYDRFGLGLRRIYPDFISAYADYGRYRRRENEPRSTAEYLRVWRNQAFPDCSSGILTPELRRVRSRVKLSGIATGCLAVRVTGFGEEVSAEVQVVTASEALLDQLAVGLPGAERFALPFTSGADNADGKARSRWSFRLVDASVDQNLVLVTNVARIAQKTLAQEIDIVVSIPGKEGLESPARPDPADGEALTPGSDGSRDAARGRLERASDKTIENGPLGQRVKRDENDALITVFLNKMPDALAVVSEINAAGGVMEQILSSATAVLDRGPGEFMRDVGIALEDEHGSITIAIPKVDYGFTGSLDGVLISTRSEAGADLDARGPVDADPGRSVLFKPSGRVTIDEYTPEFMSGSYQADLIEPGKYPSSSRDAVVVATVERHIEGRFWIGSPWLYDSRWTRIGYENAAEDAMEDIRTRLPSDLAGELESAEDWAGQRSDPRDDPEALDEVSEQFGCDCSCEGKQRLDDAFSVGDRDEPMSMDEQLAMGACVSLCAQRYLSCP